MTDFELGYTPNNLKMLREQYGLTQTDVARIVGASTQSNVARWEMPIGRPRYANMPHTKWVILVNSLRDR